MATEFDDSAHYGLFLSNANKLDSSTTFYVRMSSLVLASMRAAGMLDNLEDGTTPPATDKLWLDKNFDPPQFKEYDSISSTWQVMTFERMFNRTVVIPVAATGGTANAPTIDEPSPFMAGKVYAITPQLSNTGAVTISVTGVSSFAAVYPSGTALAANELYANSPSIFIFQNGRFELLFGYNALVRAEAAAASAEATIAGAVRFDLAQTRTDAEKQQAIANLGIGGDISVLLSSRAYVQSSYHPIVVPDFIRVSGYASAADGGGGLYRRVASDPGLGGMYMDDALGTRRWYLLIDYVIRPEMLGVKGDGSTSDATAMQSCVTFAAGRQIDISGLTIRIPSGDIVLPATGLWLNGSGKIRYEGTGNLFRAGTISTQTASFTATAGQTVFTVARTDYNGYVELFKNGSRVSHRLYTCERDGTNFTITLASGATVGDAIVVNIESIAQAGGLNNDAQVIIGDNVRITTTQANEGRALVLGWNDANYEGRENVRFETKYTSEILGETGTKGFKNAVWIQGAQYVSINGLIAGIGANDTSLTDAQAETAAKTCPYAVFLTGHFTSSDFKFGSGSISFYDIPIAGLRGSVEGIHLNNFTLLKTGRTSDFFGNASDTALLFAMTNCHAHCYDEVLRVDQFGTVLIQNNNFFQGPGSSAAFFSFIEVSNAEGITIRGNEMKSYKASANVRGVLCGSGARNGRVDGNTFIAADSTSDFTGVNCKSGSYNIVVGPNNYQNVGRAVLIEAGASKIGVLTKGDMFLNPIVASGAKRYEDAGTDTWFDAPFWKGVPAANVSLVTATATDITFSKTSDPQGLSSSGIPAAPAWATFAEIDAQFVFAANATGIRFARILKAGATTNLQDVEQPDTSGLGSTTIIRLSGTMAVSSGQALTTQVFQSSGGALNLLAAQSYFNVYYR